MTILIGLFFGFVAAFLFGMAVESRYFSIWIQDPDWVAPGFFAFCGIISLGLGYWMIMP
jgi:hypothetical protein